MIPAIYLEAFVLTLGILLLLVEAFSGKEDKTPLAWMGIAGLGVVFILTFFTANDPTSQAEAAYWGFYQADFKALFFKRFALLTTIVVLIMAIEYKGVVQKYIFGSKPQAGLGEFYALPILTCAGLMWMASAVDFIMIFVSLELVTISFYILVAYMRRNTRSLEAGVKYLILSALSTGFFVYGITWVFGVTGHTNLGQIAAALPHLRAARGALMFGFMLVLVGLGFKIAAAPFQLWVPDVYQGAPTPVTAFLSVGSKAAGFIVLMRVLEVFLSVPWMVRKVTTVIVALAALSLLYGNLAAMPQLNLKRLMAYSSIAHAGYLLIAVACIGEGGGAELAISFYLAGYLLMTLLTFLVMIVVANHSEGDDIHHFNGLSKRSPYLAFGMLVAMASLAGIPLTVGFFGKFLVFYVAYERGQFLLIGLGVITVAAGFYYYLKVVQAMYWREASDKTPIRMAPLTKGTIAALAFCIFLFGVYPAPIMRALEPPPPDTPRMAAR